MSHISAASNHPAEPSTDRAAELDAPHLVEIELAKLQLGTSSGIVNGLGEIIESPLTGKSVTAGRRDWAGTLWVANHREVWRTDGGAWHLAFHSPTRRINDVFQLRNGDLLVAMEDGVLCRGSGRTAEENRSVSNLPERALWHTPWKGAPDAHSIVESPNGTMFAAIHVGGLLISDDGGSKWRPHRSGLDRIVGRVGDATIIPGPGLNPDIHQVLIHPLDPSTILVATREGLFVSTDNGETFLLRNGNIAQPWYQRAVAVFPDRDRWLVAHAPSAGHADSARSAIWYSDDRGVTWHQAAGLQGLVSGHINTIACRPNGVGVAIAGNFPEDTQLWITTDYGRSWQVENGPQGMFSDRFQHIIRPIVRDRSE